MKERIEWVPNEEREVTVRQIDSSKTRQDSHNGNTNDADSTNQLRHGEETCSTIKI